MSRSFLAVGLLIASLLPACGEKSAPKVDCSTATVPTFAQVEIFSLCTSCHSSAVSGAARQSAPGDVNFDTYAAAKASASSAAGEVNGGEMPPAGHPQPTADQKTALYAWAACGTPQ